MSLSFADKIIHMKAFRLASAVVSSALIFAGSVHGAPAEPLPAGISDSLTHISELLFAAHYNDFLVVEALRDGYLEFGKPYTLQVNSGSADVTANGQKLPAGPAAEYASRLRDFNLYNGNKPGGRLSITFSGDGVSLDNVLDPGSKFRKARTIKPVDAQREHAKANIGRIVDELMRDSLIRDRSNFAIDYNSTALLVNGAPLPAAMDQKYRSLFRVVMDVEPRDGKGHYAHSVSTRMK
jgi:hypothetical protein